MPCKSVTELTSLYGPNWSSIVTINSGPYSTPEDCNSNCSTGCCIEVISVGKCGGSFSNQSCTPADFGMSNEWIGIGVNNYSCIFARQRPNINGGCNQADFPPLVTCSQIAQKCYPLDPCQTICIYGDVCPDPNDPNSCYQDCVSWETICENCFEVCGSFNGADFGPCIPPYQEDTSYAYGYYVQSRAIYNGSGFCPNGKCPHYNGECI